MANNTCTCTCGSTSFSITDDKIICTECEKIHELVFFTVDDESCSLSIGNIFELYSFNY